MGVALGGTDADEALHLHRQDGAAFTLGCVTISARPGPAAPSHRYEQDVGASEVRAIVTIAGNPTKLSAWLAVLKEVLHGRCTQGGRGRGGAATPS